MTTSTTPSGAAGVAYLQRVMSEISDPGFKHGYALRNIHTGVGSAVDFEMSRFCIQACYDFIEKGIPCSKENAEVYAAVTLILHSWPSVLCDETAALMAKYIERGYFRLNNTEDAFGAAGYSIVVGPGHSAIEVAIRQGNFDAALVLAQAGDGFDFVPRKRSSAEGDYKDLHELAEAFWPDNQESLQSLRAADLGWRMSEQIGRPMEVLDSHSPSKATPIPCRNRRRNL